MKKSTLITTIAMIIVVVVALSTATYAWFSSASASTATMSISSAATSGWALSKGTVNTSTKAVTFSSQSTTLDLGEALAGLYSPNAALTLAPSANTATAVTVNKATENFYACSTYNGKAYVTEASNAKDPTILRIVNGTNAEATCTVTIFVVLKEDNSNSRYAAAGLTFYFADGAKNTYTLGYNWEDASAYLTTNAAGSKKAYGSVDDLKNIEEKTSAGDVLTHTTTNVVAAKGITGDIPEYDKATLAGNTNSKTTFRKNGETAITASDKTTELVPAKATYLAYTFTTAALESGSGINFATYAWIDGWKAEDSARGSEISIFYTFGGAITLPEGTADAV